MSARLIEALTVEGASFRLTGSEIMPLLFIHARNSQFRARDEGAEYADPEAAMASGVRSAVAFITDEVNRGERSAAVEISIEQEDGTQVLCSVVTVSVSPMILLSRFRQPLSMTDLAAAGA